MYIYKYLCMYTYIFIYLYISRSKSIYMYIKNKFYFKISRNEIRFINIFHQMIYIVSWENIFRYVNALATN